MILTFKSKEVEKIFRGEFSRKIPQVIQQIAFDKLLILNAAVNLVDLKIPPSNHLEKLLGDRKGQYSIRINQQYRIYFSWNDTNVSDVDTLDYH